jgi:hypothetical protein
MKMANERTPRELETRAKFERPTKWTPPQLLPDPTPEPGYAFRWVRLSTLNVTDATNISSKLREGWEPVKASEHPEITLMSGEQRRFTDSIEIGGLLLCKTPVEFTEQRDAHYRNLANSQMDSVDNNLMRESDPRMPMFKERSSKVSAFGRGN